MSIDLGARTDEARIVIRNQEADEGKRNNVKKTDSPEDLLHRCRERFARVCRLCSCEANEFGASEGERGGDENRAEAFEAVVECSWVRPIFATNIRASGASADIQYYTENTEEG